MTEPVEKKYDVFISHSSKNLELASKLCSYLERRGVICWIDSRNNDLKIGSDYSERISQGLLLSKMVVLIFNENASKSPHVIREINQAVANGIPILPFKTDKTIYDQKWAYYLDIIQYLQSDNNHPENYFEDIFNNCRILLNQIPETDDEKYKKLIQDGMKFIAKQLFELALAKFREANLLYPDKIGAKEQIIFLENKFEEINFRISKILLETRDYLKIKEYESANHNIQLIFQISPKNIEAKQLQFEIKTAEEKTGELLKAFSTAYKNEDFKHAKIISQQLFGSNIKSQAIAQIQSLTQGNIDSYEDAKGHLQEKRNTLSGFIKRYSNTQSTEYREFDGKRYLDELKLYVKRVGLPHKLLDDNVVEIETLIRQYKPIRERGVKRKLAILSILVISVLVTVLISYQQNISPASAFQIDSAIGTIQKFISFRNSLSGKVENSDSSNKNTPKVRPGIPNWQNEFNQRLAFISMNEKGWGIEKSKAEYYKLLNEFPEISETDRKIIKDKAINLQSKDSGSIFNSYRVGPDYMDVKVSADHKLILAKKRSGEWGAINATNGKILFEFQYSVVFGYHQSDTVVFYKDDNAGRPLETKYIIFKQ